MGPIETFNNVILEGAHNSLAVWPHLILNLTFFVGQKWKF